MTTIKISQLPSAGAMTDSTVIPVVQDGANKKITGAAIKSYAGAAGATGPQGPAGPRGIVGSTGDAGPSGPAGAIGSRGYTGSAGPKGDTGNAGSQGPAGSAGPIGYTGSAGAGLTGSAGARGYTGSAGTDGASGARGYTGSAGADGASGSAGSVGLTGSTGATGSAGARGYTGSAGADGASGSAGSVGLTGSTGATGSVGLTGSAGATGPRGSDGTGVSIKGSYADLTALTAAVPTGSLGDAYILTSTGHLAVWNGSAWADVGSIQGPAGDTGPQGATGPQGPAGNDGNPGLQGDTGATGPQGDTGATGPGTDQDAQLFTTGSPTFANITIAGDVTLSKPVTTTRENITGTLADTYTTPSGAFGFRVLQADNPQLAVPLADPTFKLFWLAGDAGSNSAQAQGTATGNTYTVGDYGTYWNFEAPYGLNYSRPDPGTVLTVEYGVVHNDTVISANDTNLVFKARNSGELRFDVDGDLTVPGRIQGGPGGVNSIDLSWDLSITSGKTIRINPGSGGVVSDKIWNFGSDGNIILPQTNMTTSPAPVSWPGITFSDGTFQNTAANTTASTLVNGAYTVELAETGQLNLPTSSTASARIQATVDVDILSAQSQWTFGTDGNLTLPNGTTIDDKKDNLIKGPSLNSFGSDSYTGTFTTLDYTGLDTTWVVNGPGVVNGVIQAVNAAGQFIILDRNSGGPQFQDGESYTFTGPPVSIGSKITVNNNEWTFGTDGQLTIPGGGVINNDGSANAINIVGSNYAQLESNENYIWVEETYAEIQVNGYGWRFREDAVLELANGANISQTTDDITGQKTFNITPPETSDFEVVTVDGNIRLQTADSSGANTVTSTWTFGTDGKLQLPGTLGFTHGYIDQAAYGQPLIVSAGANLQIKTNENGNTWEFGTDGNLALPQGGVIGETATTTVITPPGAAAGQSLVLRGTSPTGITSDHPGGFTDGDTIIITVNPNNSSSVTGTVDYTFTGDFGVGGLGTATTGTLTFSNEGSQQLSWTIPVSSAITTFTFTITNSSGIGIGGMTALTLTRTGSSEASHIHLVAGDPATTDIYLGDDDQYVKIEKNGGNVVIGTDTNTKHWTFDTNGGLTLPGDFYIGPGEGSLGITSPDAVAIIADQGNTDQLWLFGTDGNVTFPDGSVQTTAYVPPAQTAQLGYFNEMINPADSNRVNGEAVAMDSNGNSYVSYSYYDDNLDKDFGGVIKFSSTGAKLWSVDIQSPNSFARYSEIISLEYVSIDGDEILVAVGAYYDNDTGQDVGFMYGINPETGAVGIPVFDVEFVADSGDSGMEINDAVVGIDSIDGNTTPYAVVAGQIYDQKLLKTLTPLAGSTVDKLYFSWSDVNAAQIPPGEQLTYNVGGYAGVYINGASVTALPAGASGYGLGLIISSTQSGSYVITRANGWGGELNGWNVPVTLTVLGNQLGGVNNVQYTVTSDAITGNGSLFFLVSAYPDLSNVQDGWRVTGPGITGSAVLSNVQRAQGFWRFDVPNGVTVSPGETYTLSGNGNDLTFVFDRTVFNDNSNNINAAVSNIQGTPISDVYGQAYNGKDWSTEIGNALTFEYNLGGQAYIARFGIGGGSWSKVIGSSNWDSINSVVTDSAGNTYAAGYAWTGSRGSLVVKYDVSGTEQWAVYIDPSNNTGNELNSIDLLADGYLITVDEDGVVTKLASNNGSIIWQVTVDDNPSWDGNFRGTATPNGDYIITNYEDDDYTMYVMRISGADGSSMWTKQISRYYQGEYGEIYPEDDFNAQYIDCNDTYVTIAATTEPPNGNRTGLVFSLPIDGVGVDGTYDQYVVSSQNLNFTTETTTSIAATLIESPSNITTNFVSPTSNTSSFTITKTSIGGNVTSTANEITNTSPEGSIYSVSVGTDGVITMTTARGGLEFGALPEPGGPSHFHIMRPSGQNGSSDLYFGDDYNYVKLPSSSYSQQGVEIGSSLNEGTLSVWRFGTDGKLQLPSDGDIVDSTGTSVLGGGSTETVGFYFNGGGANQPGTGTILDGGGAGTTANITISAGVSDSTYTENILSTIAVTGDYNDLVNTPPDTISITALKTLVAQSANFADFQSRVAAL